MFKKIMPLAIAIAAAALLTPSDVNAYGAAHVGYTHVGPNGVQHYGATEVRGPGGTYGSAHYGATSSGGAHYGYGGASGGYHYDTRYSGGAAAGGYHYGYVR